MTRVTKVGRVVVPVSDKDQAIAFYTQKLGFTLVADLPFGDGDRWIEVAPPAAA
jgi:lactoylglutathione lyase